MKILERGKITGEISCYRCNSKLEYDPSDIQSGQFGMLGDYDTEYFIICPVCGERIMLSEKNSIVKIYLNQHSK